MGDFTTENRPNVQLGIRIRNDLAEKFRALCEKERRNMNVQLEIILEDYFAQREKPAGWVSDDDIVHPSPKHMMTHDPKKPPAPNRPQFGKPILRRPSDP